MHMRFGITLALLLLLPSLSIADCQPEWKVEVLKVFNLKRSDAIRILIRGGRTGEVGLLPEYDETSIKIIEGAETPYAEFWKDTNSLKVYIRSQATDMTTIN